MSTLKTANIQDTSGGNNSTPEEIYSGRAKAWVNFDGTGTVAIRDNFNVSSITDNGTGDYTVNFTNSMANANYAVAGSATLDSGITRSARGLSPNGTNQMTASNCRINTDNDSGARNDCAGISVVVFGG